MAQDAKQDRRPATERNPAEQPAAESVDREPNGEPTRDHGLPVDQEDAPKGHPTSDRFQTEQAHKKSGEGSKGS